jgi:C1A family cysteine protease
MKIIREENLKAKNTFSLGINRFADMNEEDFSNAKVNTARSYSGAATNVEFFGAPQPVDWRSKNGSFVSPIMNEGSCDSDWAISTASVMETRG